MLSGSLRGTPLLHRQDHPASQNCNQDEVAAIAVQDEEHLLHCRKRLEIHSRSKFASLFHEVIGESPLAYLQQHRMRLASQYLRKSNYSIHLIANKVGYSSETAFSQAFKRTFEVSPKQYRQQFIEAEN